MSTCSNGRINPTSLTKKRLFADSGGYCANPKCHQPIFIELVSSTVHIAEIAHVISAGNAGPRSNKSTTLEERGKYENLILLCPTCHTIIDKAESEYPVSLLMQWKKDHKDAISKAFGIKKLSSRSEVRAKLEPLLEENLYIFENYGPMTDERFNPESELPMQWLRKIAERIIPNNRKLFMICDANREYMNSQEKKTFLEFQQHIDDFESKHIGLSKQNGKQFPEKFNLIFS